MGKGKEYTFICVPADTAPRATRLIKGTLRSVESKLRGEWEIRKVTVEEALNMGDVDLEDASGEPS